MNMMIRVNIVMGMRIIIIMRRLEDHCIVSDMLSEFYKVSEHVFKDL